MRLIDKDKLIHFLKTIPYKNSEERATVSWIIDEIDEKPRVRAIPVEWIKEWINNIKNDTRYESEYIKITKEVTEIVVKGESIVRLPTIMDMLRDWEKENEQKTSD